MRLRDKAALVTGPVAESEKVLRRCLPEKGQRLW